MDVIAESSSPDVSVSSTTTSSPPPRTLELKRDERAEAKAKTEAEATAGRSSNQTRVMTRGEMQLGGSWMLQGPSGEPVSDVGLHGSWLLLYFGFTQCPDICPEQLERNVQVVEAVERASGGAVRVRPVMVTLDPERDTPTVLARYCASYSPRMLGLTGTEEQIIACKKLYYVFSEVGQSDPNGDYLLDRTLALDVSMTYPYSIVSHIIIHTHTHTHTNNHITTRTLSPRSRTNQLTVPELIHFK